MVCSAAGMFLQTLPLEDMQRGCHCCGVCCNAVKVFVTEWVKIRECPVNSFHMNGVSSCDPFLSNTVEAYWLCFILVCLHFFNEISIEKWISTFISFRMVSLDASYLECQDRARVCSSVKQVNCIQDTPYFQPWSWYWLMWLRHLIVLLVSCRWFVGSAFKYATVSLYRVIFIMSPFLVRFEADMVANIKIGLLGCDSV